MMDDSFCDAFATAIERLDLILMAQCWVPMLTSALGMWESLVEVAVVLVAAER